MSGIDKGFLFGILTEVLRGNKRPTSVIRSVDVLIFLRYTPSKRSVLLWVEKFMTSSMTWQKY